MERNRRAVERVPIFQRVEEFSVNLDPALYNRVLSICKLLGVSMNDVMTEALEDWLESIAPVRLQDVLNSQNEKNNL